MTAQVSGTGRIAGATPISRTLTPEECWSRLREGTVGRVGVVVGGRLHILPVNYALADDDVVFRTAKGTLLDAAAGTPLVFEVDGIQPSTRSGWSVGVHGRSVAWTAPIASGPRRSSPGRPVAGTAGTA